MSDEPTLWTLLCERPVDVALFTLAPLLIGALLVVNAAAHDLSLSVPVAFAAALAAYSVLATRQHLARVRVSRLESAWSGVESSAD